MRGQPHGKEFVHVWLLFYSEYLYAVALLRCKVASVLQGKCQKKISITVALKQKQKI